MSSENMAKERRLPELKVLGKFKHKIDIVVHFVTSYNIRIKARV